LIFPPSRITLFLYTTLFRSAEGMNIHFVFMWFFAINGFIYVLYLILSGEWRLVFPNKKSFKESWQVVLHDLHIRKTAPPQKKYKDRKSTRLNSSHVSISYAV